MGRSDGPTPTQRGEDDARSAKAAGVPFIGIVALTSARREELCSLLKAEGAKAVLDDINQLESVLAI